MIKLCKCGRVAKYVDIDSSRICADCYAPTLLDAINKKASTINKLRDLANEMIARCDHVLTLPANRAADLDDLDETKACAHAMLQLLDEVQP